MVKLNVVMHDKGVSEKKIDAFKKEFKAISSEKYCKTNNLFKPEKIQTVNYQDKVKMAVKISQDKSIPRSNKSEQLTKVLHSFQKEGLFSNWKVSKFAKVCESSTKLNHALSKQMSQSSKKLTSNEYPKPMLKRP